MRRGLLYMLTASALFSVMAVLVKLLRGIPTQEIVFFRSGLNVLFTLALLRRYRIPLVGNRAGPLVIRGLVGYCALSFHFYALGGLPLADAIVIHNTSPLLVAVLAPIVLGEPSTARTLALSALGLSGVAMIVRPTGDVSLIPGLAAFGGATFSAFAYVTIRAIGDREHPLTVALYFPMISVALSAIPAARAWIRPDLHQLAALLGVGVLTTGAQIALTAALQLERASVATLMSYTAIVFTAVLGWVVFGEVPGPWTIAGTLVIVGAATAATRAPAAKATAATSARP
jgi:drug/metabolite transporter (DMT)-like permease